MNLYRKITHNIKTNKSFKGRIIVVCFTIMSFFRNKVKNKLTLVFCAPIIIFYKLVTDLFLGCEIPASTKIGNGLVIHHGRGLVLNKHVVIGNNVTLKHNTTIGNKENLLGEDLGSPIIEDNVIIGPNTVILGPIIIGKNSIIGAGSVVVKDVKPFTVVAGNPAKLIKSIGTEKKD